MESNYFSTATAMTLKADIELVVSLCDRHASDDATPIIDGSLHTTKVCQVGDCSFPAMRVETVKHHIPSVVRSKSEQFAFREGYALALGFAKDIVSKNAPMQTGVPIITQLAELQQANREDA
jgi:hypothetical protein